MFERLLAIAKNTFLETIRQPIYGVLLLATGLLLILNIFLAGFTLEDDDKLLLELGLSTILLSGLFLSAFSATGVLTREIENKTVLTIISKPISRFAFLSGKYLGLLAAQFFAFYVAFLVFVLAMHHQVLQYSTDPFDWPAILLGGGSAVLAIVTAAAANYFYGKEFCSTVMALLAPLLTVGTILTCLFDREWNRAPSFLAHFDNGRMLLAAYLIMLAVSIVAAVALAASTRLGQVATLMNCVIVLVVGFLSDWFLGESAQTSAYASVLYKVIPNFNFFWVADAINADGEIPFTYIAQCTAYAALFVVSILLIGVALFQRREVG